MKYAKDKLNLEEGTKRDWIITNGLGGYASSTIIGANTRKYHGLLVAPLTPPARRYLILSKIDESIETNGKKYNLYTNMCKNYISNGYKYLESFEKDYIPTFEYKVDGINIKKSICMEYGKNTVVILYKIKNNKNTSKLILAPIMNFRDFHIVTTDCKFDVRQEINQNKVKVVINGQSATPIYMNLTQGKYIKHDSDQFNNMYYIEEEKRGMSAEENLVVPGRYEIELEPNTEKNITFVCSLEENIEEIKGTDIIKNEIARVDKLIKNSNLSNARNKELIKTLGRLYYRTSYGQNVLKHSLEVGHIAGMLAAELGANEVVAKRAGLLHDIGKAVDQTQEGTHIQLGVELAARYGERPEVIHAIEAHHDDVVANTIEAVLVKVADAISAGRPGARRDTLEIYIKRLQKIEDIVNSYDGIKQSFAVQAGREVRIIVEAEKFDDLASQKLARDIAKRIEDELDYPGQIRVTVVREFRTTEIAK